MGTTNGRHLSTAEAAARIGTTPGALAQRVKRRQLARPALVVGGMYWWNPREVRAAAMLFGRTRAAGGGGNGVLGGRARKVVDDA